MTEFQHEGNGLAITDESAGSASMTSRAYSQMKQDIISGRLHPGQKLKIEELRQKYDTGTSPIREALSLLTSDYLVERKDQRGFRVSASAEKFEELLRTRCWLEDRAIRESIAAHHNGKRKWCWQITVYPVFRALSQQIILSLISNGKWPIKTFT